MANFIIGTAGHIDHGKTSLIKALTNIDTDRFDEEKERGITIDLGFAYFDLANGERVGIVDVPGHEKFIKNMLAGVSGIDLVLLVVAADESVMPQTREHLDILRFLDIKRGIIAITKADLVSDDFIGLVEEEIKEHVQGTFLEDAPMIRTSTKSRRGLDELIELIEKETELKKETIDSTSFRLPIDRVFTLKGFGTIITGTLIEGKINKGDDLEIYPTQMMTKARNIQVHSKDVDYAVSGQRVAINLANIDKDDIERGYVISKPNTLINSDLIDVKFELLEHSQRVIENWTRLRLYIGTSEIMCRIVLLDKETLLPGDSCYAQLRLEEAVACRLDDKFVIRFYSPLETIGGGKILDPKPAIHKRFDDQVIEDLRIKAAGDTLQIIENYIYKNSDHSVNQEAIVQHTGIDSGRVESTVQNLLKEESIIAIKNQYVHSRYIREKGNELIDYLDQYHADNPLQFGINKEELRTQLFKGLDKSIVDRLLTIFVDRQLITMNDSNIALNDFKVRFSNRDLEILEQLESYYAEAKFTPDNLSDVIEQFNIPEEKEILLQHLINDDKLVRLNRDIIIHQNNMAAAKEQLLTYLKKHGEITLGEFRDLLDSSRKIVIPILEYFDSQKITKRVDDKRILK
jgi:selenocysteine-specific elongation factor